MKENEELAREKQLREREREIKLYELHFRPNETDSHNYRVFIHTYMYVA